MRPERHLSDRLPRAEASVLQYLVEGRSHAEIATLRGTSVRTIANQLASIFLRTTVRLWAKRSDPFAVRLDGTTRHRSERRYDAAAALHLTRRRTFGGESRHRKFGLGDASGAEYAADAGTLQHQLRNARSWPGVECRLSGCFFQAQEPIERR
jgi:hypothetical protein